MKIAVLSILVIGAGVSGALALRLLGRTKCESVYSSCSHNEALICQKIENSCEDLSIDIQASGPIAHPLILAGYKYQPKSRKVERAVWRANPNDLTSDFKCVRLIWTSDISREELLESCANHADYQRIFDAFATAKFRVSADGKHSLETFEYR